MGMRIVYDDNGRRHAEQCECQYIARGMRAIKRANIPPRFESCTFETYDTKFPGHTQSMGLAPLFLKKYIDSYPYDQNRTGLLITGGVGTGKTHLAVATLRALITEYNKVGLFYDYRALLKQIQNTYSPQTAETEADVLDPVYKADILLLDELGAEKRTDWASDMVQHILNMRYNEQRTTILTTNYANEPAMLVRKEALAEDGKRKNRPQEGGGGSMNTEDTLGDRIGERMFSRIQEMCLVLKMEGGDFRKGVKRPSLL